MRASELVERCDVSKQAISQQIAHLAANDYVALDADPRDARARLVRLTTKGERAQQLVRGLFVEIERDWARQFGVEEFDSLRDLLSRLIVGSTAMKLKRVWNSSQNVHSATATNSRTNSCTRHRAPTSQRPRLRNSQPAGSSHSNSSSGMPKYSAASTS